MNINVNKIVNVKAKESMLFFTRYFFKKRFNRKFIVNSHHKQIIDVLERVIKGELTRVIINIAPRYGKTEVAVKSMIAHCLALNPAAKFIHLSYSDDLALDNSEEVKDLVTSEEFTDIFGNVDIKKDSRSKKKWYTNQGGGVLATAAGGQVTGFGAGKVDEEQEEINEFLTDIEKKEDFGGAIIIDDPIKPEDAESATIRERVNNRFDSTIRNRVNSRKTPIIIIMQRLHPDDLCGHLIKNDPDEWHVLKLPCLIKDEEGNQSSLWEFKHTVQELLNIRSMNVPNFQRQYQQDPKPREGLLYSEFKTYDELPDFNQVYNHTDTADTGKDYLCAIDYIEHNKLKYVIDILFTQKPNEYTEQAQAEMLLRNNVNQSRIESNNGGRAYARNVDRITKSLGNYKTNIIWFHQSKNKDARIKSNSSTVNNTVVMPSNWHIRWPEFHEQVTSYMAKGKNKHDDAVDVLTGIVESKAKRKVKNKN
jgi:predicted phage terminase large subunit-like protein